MAISKFALACIGAVTAGAMAGFARAPSVPPQVQAESMVTPIAAIADPETAFHATPVELTSGKVFAHVVAVSTDGAGRAARIRVALDDMPGQRLWLDRRDLVYSRSRDAIIAHDVHAPAMAVAEAQ